VEALAGGDECLSGGESGEEARECALSALQRRKLRVTAASTAGTSADASANDSAGVDWKTSGICANIIRVEDCQEVAARLQTPFARTHCDPPMCAPRGCYQYRNPSHPNNLHVYWNSDKMGPCTLERQCLCEASSADPNGYVPQSTQQYGWADPVPYGYVPGVQVPYGYMGLLQAPGQQDAGPTPVIRPGDAHQTASLEVNDTHHPGEVLTVFHQTSPAAGSSILRSGFRPGTSGNCGGAIYFTTSPHATSLLALNGRGFMIEAQVDLGRVKWMPGHCDSHMTGAKLRSMGYDSIRLDRSHHKECIHVSSCGQVVIYDTSRVISMRGYPWQGPNTP